MTSLPYLLTNVLHAAPDDSSVTQQGPENFPVLRIASDTVTPYVPLAESVAERALGSTVLSTLSRL